MKFPDWLDIYGDISFRGKCPTESAEQITFFNWVRKTEYGAIAVHIRNEGKRNHWQAAKQRAEGLCKGASDIIIPGSPSFVCELKRRDHTKCKWQEGQLDFLKKAQENGSFVCLALGYEGAKEAFNIWEKRFTV